MFISSVFLPGLITFSGKTCQVCNCPHMMDEGLHVRKVCFTLLAHLTLSWNRAAEQGLFCYEEKKLLHRRIFHDRFFHEAVFCHSKSGQRQKELYRAGSSWKTTESGRIVTPRRQTEQLSPC